MSSWLSSRLKGRLASHTIVFAALVPLPLLLGLTLLHFWHWDFSVPIAYSRQGHDELWQLVMTKTALDTGWVFTNPFLGAPGISTWYFNSAPQTSAIHNVLMLVLSTFSHDAILVQNLYYFINFPLIAISTYASCRLLKLSVLLSLAVALLFSFTTFRIHNLFDVYFSNYFSIPLGVVPVMWIMLGHFSAHPAGPAFRSVILSGRFAISVFFCFLVGVSNGYYAFFAILMFAFATFIRALYGDLRRPLSFVAPAVYVLVTAGTVIALEYPLSVYRAAHQTEASQDQMKFSAEADIYSAPLPMLLARQSTIG